MRNFRFRLKRIIKQLEPNEHEVINYAQYVGMILADRTQVEVMRTDDLANEDELADEAADHYNAGAADC